MYECPLGHVHSGVSKEFEGWFCLTPGCNRRAREKQSQKRNTVTANPQPKAVSQQSPRLEPADCTATNSGTHAGENVPIAGDTGMHSAAQRNAIPEANGRKTVANGGGSQSQSCPWVRSNRFDPRAVKL